jgi:hypothetical protein
MNLWLIDEGNLPEEPTREREGWWTVTFLSQEALAESPALVWRIYYRVAIKHYVAWGLITSVFFGLLLLDTIYQSNSSALWISFSSVLLIASIAVMVLRAVARHRPHSLSR